MSIDNIKSFWARVQADEALRHELTALRGDQDSTALAAVTALASRHGYDFTLQEYEAAIRTQAASEMQPADGLSDRDLDLVAGGCACMMSAGVPFTG